MPIRRHIIYSGQVQGVGFRATAQRLAQGFPVAGWVRNLPNGTVELDVEGEAPAVAAFLAALATRLMGYIDQRNERDEAAEGRTGFSIRY